MNHKLEGGDMSLRSLFNNSLLLAISALILALFIFQGCETNKQPSTSSNGTGTTEVNLSQPTANPAAFEEGTTSIVEVTVTDENGDPIEGIEIAFGVTPVTGGNFNPPSATTNALGIAAAIFTPAESGSMQIYGAYGTSSSPYANLIVSSGTQTSSGNLTMSMSPSLLTADGISTAMIVIQVTDAAANAAPDSTVVKLTAGEKFDDVDGNGYWGLGDSLMFDYNANETWDAVGVIPAVAYTIDGAIMVTYTAGTEATTAFIKATVSGTGAFDGSVESSIQLTPNATVHAIEISTDVTGIQVRHTGGLEMTNLEAICYDANGNTVPEGIPVQFTIADGPGGGENINGLGAGPVTMTTNSQGIAVAQVWSGTISGTLRLYASSGTVLSSATFVAVYAGPPYYMAVGSDFCNIDGWNTVNREQYIDAAVSDIYHNPVQDSVVVYFTVDEGIIDAYNITQDSTGVTQVIFRTGEPQVDGIVWVWAETSGGTVVCSTYFINSFIPSNLYASMSPQSIPASIYGNATVWVDVRDLNNNFVVDESIVKAKALYGSISDGVTNDGCNASIFEGEYSGNKLRQDYSLTGADDDGIGAIDLLTFRSAFSSTSIVCTLTTGYTFYEESSVSLDATTVPYGSTGNIIRVLIADRDGNPLGDHTLTGAISAGTMTVTTDETDTYGESFGLRFSAPADSTGGTSAVIVITDTDARGGISLSTSVTFE
ncbi:MAG: Ig-like domain-containing protein [Candidatus Zixiibacteriota bacterium]